jgi:hypothetical protein
MLDSLIGENGHLRWGRAGPLHSIAEDPRQTDLVKNWRELTQIHGDYLHILAERVTALAQETNADERALKAAQLVDDAEGFGKEAQRQIKAKIEAMHTAAASLAERMQAPGDALPPEDARRVATFFASLDQNGRDAFLRKAERAGDHKALRAVADDLLLPYVALEVRPAELRETAGRVRLPNAAGVRAAHLAMIERAERNARTIEEQVARVVHAAGSAVDRDKLNLLRRAARTARPAPPTSPS